MFLADLSLQVSYCHHNLSGVSVCLLTFSFKGLLLMIKNH